MERLTVKQLEAKCVEVGVDPRVVHNTGPCTGFEAYKLRLIILVLGRQKVKAEDELKKQSLYAEVWKEELEESRKKVMDLRLKLKMLERNKRPSQGSSSNCSSVSSNSSLLEVTPPVSKPLTRSVPPPQLPQRKKEVVGISPTPIIRQPIVIASHTQPPLAPVLPHPPIAPVSPHPPLAPVSPHPPLAPVSRSPDPPVNNTKKMAAVSSSDEEEDSEKSETEEGIPNEESGGTPPVSGNKSKMEHTSGKRPPIPMPMPTPTPKTQVSPSCSRPRPPPPPPPKWIAPDKQKIRISVPHVVLSRVKTAAPKSKNLARRSFPLPMRSMVSSVLGVRIKCKYCDKKPLKQYLENHVKDIHRNGPKWICSMCPKIYSTSKPLLVHYEADHLNKRAYCPNCQREFRSLQGMNRHFKKCVTKAKAKEKNARK